MRDSSRRRFHVFLRSLILPDSEHNKHQDNVCADGTTREPDTAIRSNHTSDYLRWSWEHHRSIGYVLILAVMTAILELSHPLFMRYIIDHVLLDTTSATTETLARLNLAGALFLLVIIAGSLLGALNSFRQRLLNVRMITSLRRRLFEQLLRLPLKKISELKTGGIISRLTGDIDCAAGLLQTAVIAPGTSAIRLVIALGILIAINWQLALIAFAFIPAIVFVSYYVSRKIRPIYAATREEYSRVDGRVAETFGGIRIVRAFQRERAEAHRYVVGHHSIVRKELFAHRRELAIWGTWGFLTTAINLVIVWIGGYMQLTRGLTSVGEIIAVQWYVFLILNPVWEIVKSISEIQRSFAGMERVFELLAEPVENPDVSNAIEAPKLVETISFENVWFAYRPGEPVVRGFDLSVPTGSVVAIVGRSGAGKTTITDLLARFHEPTQGKILLNGIDIRQMRLSSYRSLIGFVQQDVFLFDGTVSENISYGIRGVTESDVLEAATRSNAHEFIQDLTDGYSTVIGERGITLSGGQKQRLSLARAIIADPQILILDEATSNLDTESERLISDSMREVFCGRTTFVIAHRLSTVTHADIAVVMSDGRIIERGDHTSLMQQRGKYYQMVSCQADLIMPDGVIHPEEVLK